MNIKSNELAAAVGGILDDFSAGVAEGVEEAVAETGKRALRTVREKSPVKTGKYRKGWKVKKERTGVMGKRTSVVIYNKDRYQLSHLLEHGHQKPGGGRVSGTPHIRPAEELAEELLPELTRQAIEEAAR